MVKHCVFCGEEIPANRLAALPETDTCVNCSDTEKVGGLMVWEGKHTPVLEVKRNVAEARVNDREGFHASLPFGSYNNPRVLKSIQANPPNLSQQLKELEKPETVEPVQRTFARCHPDRPRVTPRGECLECAAKWYNDRNKK